MSGPAATNAPDVTCDFSGWATLRGAAAAAVSAYLLLMTIVPAALGAPFSPDLLLEWLRSAFAPMSLFVGTLFMSAASVVGLAFLANAKGNHTTYRAAAWAGACTAALLLAIACAIALLPSLIGLFATGLQSLSLPDVSAVAYFIWFTVVLMAIGAVSGLAGRVIAGAPTIPLEA